MVKQITTLLLLLTFMAQTFHRAIIVVAFYGNQEYIAKNLCENKYRPKLKCNGHCQLAKKLQQEEKKEQNNPERKLENKNEVFSYRAADPVFSNESVTVISHFHHTNIGHPVDRADDFFHPPGA